MSWEERMAARAAGRRLVREAEDVLVWGASQQRTDADEAAVVAAVGELRGGRVVDWGFGCACIGPLPGLTLCPCKVWVEAEGRVIAGDGGGA